MGGALVFTGSTDRALVAVDTATGKVQSRRKDAHEASIGRLASVSESVVASGDEDGVVKLWDVRQSDAVVALEAHGDYVSDMYAYDAGNSLLTCSGEGTLAVIDWRTRKTTAASEGDADDELLSLSVIKTGKKIVCGTTSGVLAVWSWGHWEDCSDRFPGHPESVTSLIKFDEDTLLTASSDGLIRVVQVHPNKLLGVFGEHGEFDIERMARTSDMRLLATASHDNTVKLWNLTVLADEDDDEEEDVEEEGDRIAVARGDASKDHQEKVVSSDPSRPSHAAQRAGDEDDSEDVDDSEGEGGKRRGHRKREKRRGEHKIPKKKKKHHQSSNFFSDLL